MVASEKHFQRSEVWASMHRLEFEPQGLNWCLESGIWAFGIWALRLDFQLWSREFSLEASIWVSTQGFGTQDWDKDLEAKVWTSRHRFQPRGPRGEGIQEKEKERFLHMRKHRSSAPSGLLPRSSINLQSRVQGYYFSYNATVCQLMAFPSYKKFQWKTT